ncbi:MAG: metallophosphoesterase [Ignavibacteriaceae bacterium]
MRIAHISDIHAGGSQRERKLQYLDNLIFNVYRENPDHLVITGDISDNAKAADLNDLKIILDKYGFYSSKRTSVVIGNHDIFGGVHYAADIIKFPQKCSKTDFFAKVLSFREHLCKLFDNTIMMHSQSVFPYLKIIDNTAFIALNTVDKYYGFRNPFASNGRVGKNQRSSLETLLSLPEVRDKQKVILLHHHLYANNEESKSSESALWNYIEKHTMKLRGKNSLIKLFKKYGVRLILHGHSHEMRAYSRENIEIVNAGGAFESGYGSYFVVDMLPESLDIRLEKVRPVKSEAFPPAFEGEMLKIIAE